MQKHKNIGQTRPEDYPLENYRDEYTTDDTQTGTEHNDNPVDNDDYESDVIVRENESIDMNPEIVNAPVFIKCTFARAFTKPVIQNNLSIRSYNTSIAASGYNALKNKTVVRPGQIATCTGNTFTDSKNVLWCEANLFYCNRRPTGWFRLSDVNVLINETPGTPKKSNWVVWLTGAATLFSMLK
ncbi:MAG: hypothetical protein Q7U47_01300 [Paludibacter sp.]|nr:hypothetical protein [Paludibacter sp.]